MKLRVRLAGRGAGLIAVVLSAVFAAQPDPRGDNPVARIASPEEQRAQFHVPPGFEVQLVAAEPEIQKPLNLNFDASGRLWVTGTALYPWPARTDARGEPIASFQKNWDANALAFRAASTPPPPAERGLDSVRVLSDFDPTTGRARKISIFAEGLNIPVGLVPLPRRPGAKGDTVILYSIPSIWRFEDTDGDGRADTRERLYTEFGFKDTHGMVSNFTYWADGWIYGTHGFANHSEVRDRAGNVTVLDSGNTYRFRPDGSRFEPWTHGQTNPFGLAFDERGDVYTADSHSKPVYLLVHGGYYEGIGKQHDGLGFAPPITLDNHGSSAIAGIAYYAATQFPAEYRGNLFNGNPVTRRVNRDRLEWTGSTPKAVRQPDFLTSDDLSFRPVQVKLGPDGALWIADFYNPIIGHYETPLTHPNRDRAHGRIWRVVWRGNDRRRPSPPVPNLADGDATALVERLRDENLVVRGLATNELVDRIGPRAAVPALRAAVEKTPLAASRPIDELALRFALERLGGADDRAAIAALSGASANRAAALAALRVLAERPELAPNFEAVFTVLIERTAPGHLWRATADVCASHPAIWQGPILLSMLARTPVGDVELSYGLRLALKNCAALATTDDLNRLAGSGTDAAESLAEVLLAVATPAASGFLLGHLERTRFASERAGEFARHAVLQLPADRFEAIAPLVRSLAQAPATQQLALAEGLAAASLLPVRLLPDEVGSWMRRTLVALFVDPDANLARRAVDAAKELSFPEKNRPLREIVVNAKAPSAVRLAAVRAVDVDVAGIDALSAIVTRPTESTALRRAAVERLTAGGGGDLARSAISAALPVAPNDLALVMAIGLAKNEAGAGELVALVAAGRTPASLLRHRYVALELEKRAGPLQARVAELTRNLPAEDARLDAIIAQRATAFAAARPNSNRGAEVFAQNCALCHRLNNAGGSLGPSLDGIAVRGVQRLIEDILDPNRNVDPAFRLTTVGLKSGETKSGLNLRDEGDMVVLTDPATGQDLRLLKASVVSTRPSALSPMPAAFESALSESDFFDLIGYLRSPAGGSP